MVETRDLGILENIKIHCNKIELKVSKLTKEEYDKNEDYCDLICFHILQIGELVKHLTKEFTSSHQDIPWNKIARMRDKVAHGYGSISAKEVWDIAISDVHTLNTYCTMVIESCK